jgi:AcrR family transcriptional regulator
MAIAEDTRERILEAAAAAFAEKGFEAATIRDICQRAGANLAAVNYHFGDKEQLYLELIQRAHRLREQQVPLPHWPAGTPAAEKLRGFIRTTMVRMVEDPAPQWQMQIMMREMFHPTKTCQALVQDFFRQHFELLLSILRELVPLESDEKLHLIGFSIIGQCLHYRVARPVVELLVGADENAGYTADLLAEHIADFSLRALGVPGRNGQPRQEAAR